MRDDLILDAEAGGKHHAAAQTRHMRKAVVQAQTSQRFIQLFRFFLQRHAINSNIRNVEAQYRIAAMRMTETGFSQSADLRANISPIFQEREKPV